MSESLPPLAIRLPAGGAEELVRLTSGLDVGAVVVGPDALAGPGPPLVGALARIATVVVDTRVSGVPGGVAAEVASLAGFGAAVVTVSALAGEQALEASLSAVEGRKTLVVAAAVTPDVRASLSVFGARDSVGKVVSRATRAAAGAGVEAMLCEVEHLGVVAEVAPKMRRLSVAASPEVAEDARRRGASAVLLDLGLGGVGLERARAMVTEAVGTVSGAS